MRQAFDRSTGIIETYLQVLHPVFTLELPFRGGISQGLGVVFVITSVGLNRELDVWLALGCGVRLPRLFKTGMGTSVTIACELRP
jgi:hypothetical protein